MENENLATMLSSISSMTRDDKKLVTILRGAGKKGKEVISLAQWKTECKSYFNRFYKTSNVITGPSDMDIIMDTLSEVCNDNSCKGFVFKDYNIVNHLKFLGFDKTVLETSLGTTLSNDIISYLAYLKKENMILVCKKFLNKDCLKKIVIIVKYFLILYNKELQETGVTVMGLLIREDESQEEVIKCNFCDLLSPSHKVFQSGTLFKAWLRFIAKFVDFDKPDEDCTLLTDLATEILCFMALQSWNKDLPNLGKKISEQFKQTYLLFTPQQMKVHLSDAKHVIIHGSYGSGKSVLGLKKLELILENIVRTKSQNEMIIYINFDSQSQLHHQMENNIKDCVKVSKKKISLTKNIQEILKSPNALIHVCHNSIGENLSTMLEQTVKIQNLKTKGYKVKFHIIVEEYDGEMLNHNEARKISKLVKDNFGQSNIIVLVQPLIKKRICEISKKIYTKQTYMFDEFKSVFKIVKLSKVLRSSNEIYRITESTQVFVGKKESVFTTGLEFSNNSNMVPSDSSQKLRHPRRTVSEKFATSSIKDDSSTKDILEKRHELFKNVKSYKHIDLDQALEKLSSIENIENRNTEKDTIKSKFGFFCKPTQGVDIDGGIPKLVEFSDSIHSKSDLAVISLALVLGKFIGENQITALLHIADKTPPILRRASLLFPRLFSDHFSYTECVEDCFQRNIKSKMVFSSNFRTVNGMEFDHVVVLASYTEYYAAQYLPQVISRCTYNLHFVLLPKDNVNKETSEINEAKDTVADMVEELKQKHRMRSMYVCECRLCEIDEDADEDENENPYSISKEAENKFLFRVHTHSAQYKDHLTALERKTDLKEQEPDMNMLAKAT